MLRLPRAVQLPRAADRWCASAAWPTPAPTRSRRRRSPDIMVRGYRLPLRFGQASRSSGLLPCLAAGHHRRLLHDHGLAADPLQHQRGQLGIVRHGRAANWDCTPQQISFAVLSTGGSSWAIAATFEGPERRLSVADQFGSDRLHDLGRIVEPVVTVGSSMLIALQACVG